MTKAAKPADQNAPVPRPKRRIGFMEGEFVLPDDFDTMYQAEIEEMFYGGSIEPELDTSEPKLDPDPVEPPPRP